MTDASRTLRLKGIPASALGDSTAFAQQLASNIAAHLEKLNLSLQDENDILELDITFKTHKAAGNG